MKLEVWVKLCQKGDRKLGLTFERVRYFAIPDTCAQKVREK